MQNHIFRIALGTAVILLIPLVAMQFTDEVNWDEADFIVMGVLVFGTGLMFDLIMKKVRNNTYRVVIGVALLAAFLYIWAELAVGIFTDLGS